MVQKFEYKVLKISDMSDEVLGKTLAELGQNGWQIVADKTKVVNGMGGTTGLILSRPEDEKFPKETKEMERQAELQINEEEWPEVAFPRK